MRWIKKGLIFKAESNFEWMVSHASLPVADHCGDNRLRIYFGTRDAQGRSLPAYIEVEAGNPENVLNINSLPLLSWGDPGTFDDNGIMPSWIIDFDSKKYLYYIGWNPQVTVAYRLSIGLAISEDQGKSFEKYSKGPICDRSVEEPYFNTAPCVLFDAGKYRMWYVSCTGWKMINSRSEPSYHVKYAESANGVNWIKTGIVCIDYDVFTEAIGRPCVFIKDGTYRMFYSYRQLTDYRTDPNRSYRLGYAESSDGIQWIRKDDEVGISRSETGWDSEMMEYCYVYQYQGRWFLLYNGNGFGKSGFGYAVLDES
ncbi:hypothetical protein L0222_23105 [bacterium]|nr:hypothetical protein [bacterium]MCI0602932.1 hypothetical protein [bacterium]